MGRLSGGVKIALLLILMLVGTAWAWNQATAQNEGRQTTIVIPYTEYEWWLIRWTGNDILCRIKIDHAGLPTTQEVLQACGSENQAHWLATPPCKQALKGDQNTQACSGLYLYLLSSQPKTKEVVIELPPPQVWVTLDGCDPHPPENRCETLPTLVLTGEEPLPNEVITNISGRLADMPFSCDSTVCRIPLRVTPLDGITVDFSAKSSYGDRSTTFIAYIRVIETGVSAAPGNGGWYVDVLSSQWRGEPVESCAETWEAFLPIGGLPTWLSTPDRPELLASDEAYYYLAGRLISQGVVDASQCITGGLLPNGYADACGLETAKSLVEAWQNQFDLRIIDVAKDTGVPATLMKNLFAQESQFWPGVYRVPYEFGLGQITDAGADTVLLWNSTFFDQFCPLILAKSACAAGYLGLKPGDQAILRGALALEAKSDCLECPTGIDLTNADFSVALFANTIQANCEQISQIIYTATQERPGAVASYEDLWRFTIANYHAGPGCVSYAIHTTWAGITGKLTWDEVSTRFTVPCQGVIPYVNKITR